MIEFCHKPIISRSKYADVAQKRCWKPEGHSGRCREFPYLKHLKDTNKRVADKIKRDARMTTGAAWKSDDAGPNRIYRWVMMLSDEELLEYGLDMEKLRPGIEDKLRDKAAPYEDCIESAQYLTWSVYQMPDSPRPPEDIRWYLEEIFGPMEPNSTVCTICKGDISFNLFAKAKRGKAPIETCHKNPRIHNAENIGFAHRRCNIAQGPMTLNEFYDWMENILERVGRA